MTPMRYDMAALAPYGRVMYGRRAAGSGIEFGAPCPVLRVSGRQTTADEPRSARPAVSSTGDVLVGYGVVFGKTCSPNQNGQFDVFERGCFAEDVRKRHPVAFLREHDWARRAGGIDDGNLDLFEDDHGLAFALRPSADAEGRSLAADVKAGWLRTSVRFRALEVTEAKIGGEPVRFIRRAVLSEISAVKNPALRETSIFAMERRSFTSLAALCRSGDLRHKCAGENVSGAFRALRKYLEQRSS